MRGVLVDAGPLIAIVDAEDASHERCVRVLERIREPLFTVWPAVTEAMHLVGAAAHERLWNVVEHAPMRFATLDASDVPAVRALMKKYADIPMDLADAALVHVAAREGIHTVFTVDRADFGLYRLPGGRRLRLLP